MVDGHDGFHRPQAFDAGGYRGLREDVLLSGSRNLNPWIVSGEPAGGLANVLMAKLIQRDGPAAG